MKINEVVKKLNITHDTLRFYEKSGLLGEIKRDKSGYRNYDEGDIKRIEFILCMRNVGVPIEVLKEYIYLYDLGDDTFEQRKALLIEQKKQIDKKIEEMQLASKKLEYKINLYYEGKLDEYLKVTNNNDF